jgi:hypothetical protein
VESMRHTATPLDDALINQHIESPVRATVLSMTSQTNAVGQIIGGPAVGALGSSLSLRAALMVAGLIEAPVVALYGRMARRDVE